MNTLQDDRVAIDKGRPRTALTDAHAMRRLGHASGTSAATGVRIDGCLAEPVDETLADETPVALAFNGVPHAVMMATPADLEDFAVGFALTEGIVGRQKDVEGVTVVRHSRGIDLMVEIPLAASQVMRARQRQLAGRTGCGICGASSVDEVLRDVPPVEGTPQVAAVAVSRAMRELATRQPLNAATGATHAAAWASLDGSLAYVREDVGRHNALDKVVGAVLRDGTPASEGFIVVTSRASFELVQKAAVLGVGLLAAVSAPTALAVRVAHSVGLTLVGFARQERMTIYAHPSKVQY